MVQQTQCEVVGWRSPNRRGKPGKDSEEEITDIQLSNEKASAKIL